MSTTIEVKGLKDLNRFLQLLPAKMEGNVLRGGLRAGAKVLLAEAKSRVPARTGLLRKDLKVTTKFRAGRVTASVKATGKHGYIAYWLEFTGAASHVIKAKKAKFLFFGGGFFKKVNHPGFPARPFMRPALQAGAQAAIRAAAEYIKRRLATKHGLDTSDVEIE